MNGYSQLTQQQRYQIEAYLGTGMRKREIAERIGVHRSTVYREIKRNSNVRLVGYKACPAIAVARERHEVKKKHRIDCQTWTRVDALVKMDWSPEQISERLKLEGHPTVSHETIYLRIYEDKRKGGELYKHLRRPHGYRKRNGKYCKRVGWDTRRFINERPPVVDERSRLKQEPHS
ncbi:MAG: IS30 family transposase [Pyrinomonadaceae bacterium]